jgi:hypothetical protein
MSKLVGNERDEWLRELVPERADAGGATAKGRDGVYYIYMSVPVIIVSVAYA